MGIKERGFFVVALALSLAANLWLAWRLYERPTTPLEKQQLQEVRRVLEAWMKKGRALSGGDTALALKSLATRMGKEAPQAGEPQKATLALALGDCSGCFAFLKTFAFFCQGREAHCQVLLVGGTAEEAAELARKFALQVPVKAHGELPPLPVPGGTPVVWVGEAASPLLVEYVPPDPQGQRSLLLKLLLVAG
ncbi:MAG: hypothetical protein ACUVRY_03500 [Thermoanaerobaculaceae bacterium]